MANQLSIDTNVLVALVDGKDKWHQHATAIGKAAKEAGAEIVYFDCVINETVGVLARRLREQRRANQFASLLSMLQDRLPETAITWISQDTRRLYREILGVVGSHMGELNFHDALIALACRDLGIQCIASFDRDFDHVGWLTRVEDPDDLDRAFPCSDASPASCHVQGLRAIEG